MRTNAARRVRFKAFFSAFLVICVEWLGYIASALIKTLWIRTKFQHERSTRPNQWPSYFRRFGVSDGDIERLKAVVSQVDSRFPNPLFISKTSVFWPFFNWNKSTSLQNVTNDPVNFSDRIMLRLFEKWHLIVCWMFNFLLSSCSWSVSTLILCHF